MPARIRLPAAQVPWLKDYNRNIEREIDREIAGIVIPPGGGGGSGTFSLDDGDATTGGTFYFDDGGA